jgi:hypothetical protein
LVTATAAGLPTVVHVNYSNGTSNSWYPFGTTFRGGASVALGDVNGDGIPDIVVASGISGTSLAGTVQVYDGSTGKLIGTYHPFGAFGGGLDVAVGNITGTGSDQIVVGIQGGGSPDVEVLNGTTGNVIDRFMAYAPAYMGGVSIAVGDTSGSGHDDIVVAPGAGSDGRAVKVYSGQSVAKTTGMPVLISSFVAFPASYTGAVSVAVGNLTAGAADIVVGSQSSNETLKVYRGATLSAASPPTPIFTQNAWAASDTSGVKVALVPNSSANGMDDLVVTDGTGSRTARYLASQLTARGWPTADAEYFIPIPTVNSPIFVG